MLFSEVKATGYGPCRLVQRLICVFVLFLVGPDVATTAGVTALTITGIASIFDRMGKVTAINCDGCIVQEISEVYLMAKNLG